MTEDYPGSLSIISLSNNDRELLNDYLDKTKPYLNIRYLEEIFKDDEILKFFDVFSNVNIKIPSREEISKLVTYIKIYNYCKNSNFTEESYQNASKLFGRRVSSIKRIIEKIELKLQ